MAGNSFFVQLSNKTGIEMQRWWVSSYYGTTDTYTSYMSGVQLQNEDLSYLGGIYSAGSGGVNVQVMFVDGIGNLWSTPGWTYIKIPPATPSGAASICQIEIGPTQGPRAAARALSARWASGGEPLETSFYVNDKPTPATVSMVGPTRVSPAVLYLGDMSGEPLSGLELSAGTTRQVQVYYVSDLLNPRPENVTTQATIESSANSGVCSISKTSDFLNLKVNDSRTATLSASYKGYTNFVRVTLAGRDRS
jgi:hypothetical protein